jgi:2-hydroxychromene-2-carboxylate isomerase
LIVLALCDHAALPESPSKISPQHTARKFLGRRIDNPATIADVLTGLKIDSVLVLANAQSDKIKSELRAQTEEAERLGVFGSPTFITADGELFWGNDRLERALLWAKQGH